MTRVPLRDGVLLAVGTLTVARVPPPRTVDAARAGLAMTIAPLVGALLAVPAVLVALLARAAGTGPLVAAALGIGVLAWGSGGLHLDGLADTVDGVAAGRGDPARALEIMRQGQVGPLGAATLVLVLVVQVAALARCLSVPGLAAGALALPAAAAAGRCALPLLCARGVPAARTGGLGAAVAGTVPRPVALAVPLVTAGLAALAVALAPGLLPGAGPARVAVAVLGGCLAGVLLAARAGRRIGGVTGDLLGAGVEWGVAAALVLLATR